MYFEWFTQDVPCGDGSCPNGNTCCLTESGSDGCCPLLNANCCPNGLTCCPAGYSCVGNLCVGSDHTHPVLKLATLKMEPKKISKGHLQDVPCGDGSCPNGNTCCLTESGSDGCCPLLNANCCPNGLTCCPAGYSCVGNLCIGSDHTHPVLKLATLKMEPKKISKGHLQDVPCGDGSCPNGNTCCLTESGSDGCCPLLNANCCPNGLTCCPAGSSCVGNLCIGSDHTHPVLKLATLKMEPKKISKGHLQDVPCGDGSCPNGNTCCLTESGSNGCCPLLNANCCPNRLTCCPAGYNCCPNGLTCCPAGYSCVGNLCVGSDHTHPVLKLATLKMEPKKISKGHLQDVPCGDGSCPNGNTCCLTESGSNGCCPLLNANCCPNRLTCCPAGYNCCPNGLTCCPAGYSCVGNLCVGSDHTHPVLKLATLKMEPKKISKGHLQDVPCGDGSCPNGNTCCLTESGSDGCCPLLNANCCPNGLTCCPAGYSCVGNLCIGSDHTHPVLKLATLKMEPKKISKGLLQDVPCGDGSCPNGNTCCPTESGSDRCCTLLNANCCPNGLTCCPAGSSCVGNLCVGSDHTHPILKLATLKMEPKKISKGHLQDVPCSDGSCQNESTCCRVGNSYGCCPVLNANCCPNRLTCCPPGYSCAGNKCVGSDHTHPVMNLLMSSSGIPRNEV